MKQKSVNSISEKAEEDLLRSILSSRKYRNLGIPDATVLDLIRQAQVQSPHPREVEKIVKTKMHNLIAPYLGDADFSKAEVEMDQVFQSKSEQAVRNYCLRILNTHASTRERVPLLPDFYRRLFEYSGTPHSILDLACGLNPFSLPWMNLPADAQYYAYDIVQPRLNLINQFLRRFGKQPLAENRDILVDPPQIQADAAFFFKEAHRFEQRQKGCNRAFWFALKVKTLYISLPTANLTGTHSKLDQHRKLVYDTLSGLDWPVSEILFENEIVFCIQKGV